MFFYISNCRVGVDCKINRSDLHRGPADSVEEIIRWLEVRVIAMHAVAKIPGLGRPVAQALLKEETAIKNAIDGESFVECFLKLQKAILLFKSDATYNLVFMNEIVGSGVSVMQAVESMKPSCFEGARPDFLSIPEKAGALGVSRESFREMRVQLAKKWPSEPGARSLANWERCPNFPGCTHPA